MAAMASAFSTPSAVSIWHDEGGARVGAAEFVSDGAGPVVVMGDLQGNAARPLRVVFHAVDDAADLVGRADHGQHEALGAGMSQARAM